MTEVNCACHGPNTAAYVCACMARTLQDKEPRGLNWFIEDDGSIQAFCDACWTCDIEEFKARTADGPTVICLACLNQVAQANGTWLDFSEEAGS